MELGEVSQVSALAGQMDRAGTQGSDSPAAGQWEQGGQAQGAGTRGTGTQPSDSWHISRVTRVPHAVSVPAPHGTQMTRLGASRTRDGWPLLSPCTGPAL